MKSLRFERWASHLQQAPRNPRLLQRTCPFSSTTRTPRRELQTRYRQLQSQGQNNQRRTVNTKRRASTSAAAEQVHQEEAIHNDQATADEAIGVGAGIPSEGSKSSLNFPSHREAIKSAKLAALHARLSLPSKLPLQTLARCLIDPSVDPRPEYNNAPMAILGQELLGYYTTEWLVCKYPRLPMSVLMAAAYGYLGNATLNSMRLEWGVEAVAAPGPEVDAGLLQLKRTTPGNAMAEDGTRRVKDVEQDETNKRHRHKSIGGRIVYDDMFGEAQDFLAFDVKPYAGAPVSEPEQASEDAEMADSIGAGVQGGEVEAQLGQLPLRATNTHDVDMNTEPATIEDASAGFVRALTGAIYLHAGTNAVKEFHKAHVLSRHLPLHTMFSFKHPTQDLSKLCRREGWESPVARLISETGRLSRTPVFIVGVFSGEDKLGEGAGSSLNEGRVRAAVDALKSWYLYSPMDSQIVYPSEVEGPTGKKKKWIPQYVDPGEIVA